MWKLFLDDERVPVGDDWVIARSSDEAELLVLQKGFPSEIAFDHDLGGDDTAMNFLRRMQYRFMDREFCIPKGFVFEVHSQNPIGGANIVSLMRALIRHFSEE